MTGFGTGVHPLPNGRLSVEIRSVNSRSLDIRVKLPEAWGDSAMWADQAVRKKIRRGRVEVVFKREADLPDGVVNVAALKAVYSDLRAVALELGLALPTMTDVILAAKPTLEGARRACEAESAAAAQALDSALCAHAADRLREGTAIRDELSQRTRTLQAAIERIRPLHDALLPALRERLRVRLEKAGCVTALADRRFNEELLLLAERGDFSEELARLETHIGHLGSLCASDGTTEVVEGKRLEFLLQEMLREASTMTVKAQSSLVSHEVVLIKVEIERMREQVQNVE